MLTKTKLRMSIKQVAPDGSFEGRLAVYNNIDLGGDLIEPGAFTKTILEKGNTVPMLWQHKSDKPIGLLTLIDGPDALHVKGQLEMGVQDARDAYILIKSKIVKGLSIGFDTVKDATVGTVRHLKELRLWEGSIVTFPMNEQALIQAVKARKEAKADFTTEYAEVQLQEAAYQMWIALRSALCSIPWSSELSAEEKVEASQASIEQFSAAYMEFIPTYIAWLDEEYGAMFTMGKEPAEQKAARELKKGKAISAANMKKISAARDHTKSADDALYALLSTEAEDDEDDDESDKSKNTSAPEAAAIPETEPVAPDHSAALETLTDWLRSQNRAA